MKLSKFIYFALFPLSILFIQCSSMEQKHKDSTHDNIKVVAREIMINSGYCALITQGKDGVSKVRTMDAFEPEDDFTVWFGTNPRSRKVEQIRKDNRVTLYYFDTETLGYVIIQGNAELVNDTEMKKIMWKDEWEEFYPDKEKDYLLIKVSPQWMEVLSPQHDINNDSVTWEPPRIEF